MENKESFIIIIRKCLKGLDLDLPKIEFSSISLARVYLSLAKTHISYIDLASEREKEIFKNCLNSLKFDRIKFRELVNDSNEFWDSSRIENQIEILLDNNRETMIEIINILLDTYKDFNKDDFTDDIDDEVQTHIFPIKDEQ